MEKGKGKGKGKKKKDKEPKQEDPNFLSEVDKTFYELQITDLNRKLTRLRTVCAELETKNEELTASNIQIDEDRADVISYLKRTLLEKENELKDMHERLKALHETRQEETQKSEEKINGMETDYKTMQDQLNSEIKLLQGKLNSLEEFRVQKEDLTKKYEEQEKNMQEQEERHKQELYEIERKFIIGKDKLKKEMEARLLQLSTDFQDATEVRIAATTHRVIRENIAINNELDILLETQQRLQSENNELKQKNKVYRLQTELHAVETKKSIHKSKIQSKLIEKLTKEHSIMVEQIKNLTKIEEENNNLQIVAVQRTEELEVTKIRVCKVEQHLQVCQGDIFKLKIELKYYTTEYNRLIVILCTAVKSIKGAMDIQKDDKLDQAVVVARRENLLVDLLSILTMAEEQKPKLPEFDSVDTMNARYMRGDLGFVPKKTDLKQRDNGGKLSGTFKKVMQRIKSIKKSDDESSDTDLRTDSDVLRQLLEEHVLQKKVDDKDLQSLDELKEEEIEETYFDVDESDVESVKNFKTKSVSQEVKEIPEDKSK